MIFQRRWCLSYQKFDMNGIRDRKTPILHFFNFIERSGGRGLWWWLNLYRPNKCPGKGLELSTKCWKRRRVGVKGFLNNVKKLQYRYFWACLNQSLSLQIKLRKSFVKHMSGRHTNINHFLNGVQNLDSGQSDINCKLEVHVEFGLKRRMWARLEICKRFLKVILSKL